MENILDLTANYSRIASEIQDSPGKRNPGYRQPICRRLGIRAGSEQAIFLPVTKHPIFGHFDYIKKRSRIGKWQIIDTFLDR